MLGRRSGVEIGERSGKNEHPFGREKRGNGEEQRSSLQRALQLPFHGGRGGQEQVEENGR